MFRNSPSILCIGYEFAPFNCIERIVPPLQFDMLIQKIELFSLAPHLRHTVVKQLALRVALAANRYRYPDADLYPEHVMTCAADFRVLAHIAMQVEMVNPREIL